MPHNITLITTIAAALCFGLIFGLIAIRLKLPPLVGYLAAGVLIGPSTPGFVADAALTEQLAEIGVMLLMFGVGLHFSLNDLLKVCRIALPGAILQIIIATGMGMGLAHLWDWDTASGLVFGLSLSVASTVVLLRTLESRGLMDSTNGQIAVGWLVVEDLVMVLVLVLLPPISSALIGNEEHIISSIAKTLAITFAQVIAFIVFMLVVGRRFFPWFLWRVARIGSREIFTLTVIAAAVGVAYGSSQFFGVSFALGAFFAGMILRKCELSHRAAEETLPLRDAFSVLFFVSVGMLFQPSILIDSPSYVLATVAIIILGKFVAAFLIVLALRYPLNIALTVSASLAQIGEFSFILAALGLTLGLLSTDAHSIILAGALISITVNPLIFRAIEPLQKWIPAHPDFMKRWDHSAGPLAELPESVDEKKVPVQVVLIGYGKVGRKVADYLSEHGISFVVAEQNRKLVQQMRKQGIAAVAGNATEPSVLVRAHVAKASILIVATHNAFHVRAMIKTAKALNPTIMALIRTHNENDAELLQKENIGKVFLGEQELATAMASYIFKLLDKEEAVHLARAEEN
ncbi:MAG: sodium/hydrogen exchanger family protein [Solimicrobium sp.]|jgi:CPA2 family monovalent cation:H+ antiporter-2|nr:sodium/hydrogen exchanger family protein [Solimicrobium sp.]